MQPASVPYKIDHEQEEYMWDVAVSGMQAVHCNPWINQSVISKHQEVVVT